VWRYNNQKQKDLAMTAAPNLFATAGSATAPGSFDATLVKLKKKLYTVVFLW